MVAVELRYEVYKYALITDCVQPGIADSYHKQQSPRTYCDYYCVPAVHILRLSKQVNNEGTVFLYAYNTFSTCYRPTGYQIAEILEEVVKLPTTDEWDDKPLPSDSSANLWIRHRAAVAQVVSSIHDPDCTEVPKWLTGPYPCEDYEWDPWAYNPNFHVYGVYLVALLRRIGVANALRIERIELTLGSLQNALDILPLFSEILRQHVKGLQLLVVGKSLLYFCVIFQGYWKSIDFDCIDDYGSDLEVEERNEYRDRLVVAFFYSLSWLAEDNPKLKAIQLFACSDGMQAMANAVIEKKRSGVRVDLTQKWRTLVQEAKERILATMKVADASLMEYPVETYIHRPNWERFYKNKAIP